MYTRLAWSMNRIQRRWSNVLYVGCPFPGFYSAETTLCDCCYYIKQALYGYFNTAVVFQGEAGRDGLPGHRGDEGIPGPEVSPTGHRNTLPLDY